MIKNHHKYVITQQRVKEFTEALQQAQLSGTDVHPVLRNAQVAGIRSVLADLNKELADYERRMIYENLGVKAVSMSLSILLLYILFNFTLLQLALYAAGYIVTDLVFKHIDQRKLHS